MSIGSSIRHIRENRGMSQVELAEKVNITQSMLCQIERGTKSPSLPLSTEIAAALGCTLNDIVEGA
ncbi:MAG TPA: helix-turn-helix domain-containing protein [Firmicutes bacterium]|nr:helix-turn-helix domain-containing protein [Bacillota bacterium]